MELGSNPDPESRVRSGYRLQIQTTFSLADVCSLLYVLLRTPTKLHCVYFGPSVCLTYVCQTITFERLDVGSSYLHMRYISIVYG